MSKTNVNHHLTGESVVGSHVTGAGGAWLEVDAVTLFLPTLVSLDDKLEVLGKLEAACAELRAKLERRGE